MTRTRIASVLPWMVAALVGVSVGAAVQVRAQEDEQLYPGTFCFSRYDETNAVYDRNRYVNFGLPQNPGLGWAMCPFRNTSDFTAQTLHSSTVAVRAGGSVLVALCRSQSESQTFYDCGAARSRWADPDSFGNLPALPAPTAGVTTSTSSWFVFAQLQDGASIARYCARRAGASATMCPAP